MIRYPLTTLFSNTVATTTSTTLYQTFVLPNFDMDGLVVKFHANSFSVGDSTASVKVFVQTTDGTNYFDCAACTINATITAANSNFATIPVNIGDGKFVVNPSAGSIAANSVTGIPFLGTTGRLTYVFTNAGTTIVNLTTDVLAQSQSVGR